MQGSHLTADLHNCHCHCASHGLLDAKALGAACVAAADTSGLQCVAQLFHTFPATAHGPGGSTATPDVYVCNFGGDHSAKTHALLNAQVALLAAISA